MPVQHIDYPNTGGPSKLTEKDGARPRVETGAVQFGDDWPGLFIRGDNAAYYAMCISAILKWYEDLQVNHPELALGVGLEMMQLQGLASIVREDVIVKTTKPRAEKRYAVMHWDTFTNETTLVHQTDDMDAAVRFIQETFRISAEGADVVKILDTDTNKDVGRYQIR